MIIGHQKQLNRLQTELPRVTLLKGPAGVGKHAIVQHLLDFWSVHPVDRLWATSVDGVSNPLTVKAAEEVKKFFSTAPLGERKVFCASLDNAHPNALNAMLKLLEEPPAECYVILWTSEYVLPTVESRAHVEQFGMLTVEEMTVACQKILGLNAKDAAELAPKSMGTVAGANAARSMVQTRSAVLNVLRATAEGDFDLFDNALTGLNDESVRALVKWAQEARTGRWRMFSEDDSKGLHKNYRAVESVLRVFASGASWRTGVRASLGPVCFAQSTNRV